MDANDVFDVAMSVARLMGHRSIVLTDGPLPEDPTRWRFRIEWVREDGTRVFERTFVRKTRRSAGYAAVKHLSNMAINIREQRYKENQ